VHKTKAQFQVHLSELSKKAIEEILKLCDKIDELFEINDLEWSHLHVRFYKTLASAIHLVKHQKHGTHNTEFYKFVIDKQAVFKDLKKFYNYKNQVYSLLKKEVDFIGPILKVGDIISFSNNGNYIITNVRKDTLDRYFCRYDLFELSSKEKSECSNIDKFEVTNRGVKE
jgi:hypothetical protein